MVSCWRCAAAFQIRVPIVATFPVSSTVVTNSRDANYFFKKKFWNVVFVDSCCFVNQLFGLLSPSTAHEPPG